MSNKKIQEKSAEYSPDSASNHANMGFIHA